MPSRFDFPNISRREILRLTAAAAAGAILPTFSFGLGDRAERMVGDEEIAIGDAGLRVTFARNGTRLSLRQIQSTNQPPLLYSDAALKQPGAGNMGNPLAVEVLDGPSKGQYGMDAFEVTSIERSANSLLVYSNPSSSGNLSDLLARPGYLERTRRHQH